MTLKPPDYFDPAAADFLVFPPMVELPPRGVLGAALDDSAGSAKVVGFASESAARDAGIAEGDHVVAIDGKSIRSVADVRIALLDRKPGEEVTLEIVRGAGRTKAIRVKLGSDPGQESIREK